ncbi:MAG: hypothetical protein QXJ95_08220 [Ignisphaera sp.]
MWYQYRKSPLGTVVRESMKTVLGIYSREEAIEKLEKLSSRLSAKIEIVDIKQNIHEILTIDPDLGDIIWRDLDSDRVALVASWNPLER